ncbi:MAG: hypothetical protein QXQ14_00160 [Candidatus Aenigmatarchaeota archaeon]
MERVTQLAREIVFSTLNSLFDELNSKNTWLAWLVNRFTRKKRMEDLEELIKYLNPESQDSILFSINRNLQESGLFAIMKSFDSWSDVYELITQKFRVLDSEHSDYLPKFITFAYQILFVIDSLTQNVYYVRLFYDYLFGEKGFGSFKEKVSSDLKEVKKALELNDFQKDVKFQRKLSLLIIDSYQKEVGKETFYEGILFGSFEYLAEKWPFPSEGMKRFLEDYNLYNFVLKFLQKKKLKELKQSEIRKFYKGQILGYVEKLIGNYEKEKIKIGIV